MSIHHRHRDYLVAMLVLFASSPLCLSFAATSGDIQATWIPTLSLTSPQQSCEYLSTLASRGVNRIYVDVWHQGQTYFPSPTMKSLLGGDGKGIGPDHLSWVMSCVQSVHTDLADMEVYAWFEYGLMGAYGSCNATAFCHKAQQLGWVKGTYDGFVWMNPGDEKVVEFIASIMADAVHAHPTLAGVQLDDHFSYPVSLGGYSPSIMTNAAQSLVQTFSRRVGRSSAPSSAHRVNVSLAPDPPSFALSKYNVDWSAWASMGLFDEYCPQLYTTNAASFTRELSQVLDIPHAKPLIAGVRCNGSGSPTPWGSLGQMVNASLHTPGCSGASLWYSNCLTQVYPSHFGPRWGTTHA